MTVKQKKEWLSKGAILNAEIKTLESRKAYWQGEHNRICENTVNRYDNDYIKECISKVQASEREIISIIDKRVDCVRKIEKAINELKSEKEKYILTEHYINCVSFAKIARHMIYSERQIINIANSAIKKLRVE